MRKKAFSNLPLNHDVKEKNKGRIRCIERAISNYTGTYHAFYFDDRKKIDKEVNDKSSPWKTAPFKDSVVHKPTGDNEVTCKKKKNVENNDAKEGAVRCVFQILKW